MAQDHVRQEQGIFIIHAVAQRFRRFAHIRHAGYNVPQQQAFPGILTYCAQFIGVHLIELAQVMHDDPGRYQISIQIGITVTYGFGGFQHISQVMQQTAALGVVHAHGSGIIKNLVRCTPHQFTCNVLEHLVLHAFDHRQQLRVHLIRRAGRSGYQLGQIDNVVCCARAHTLYTQLQPAVIFCHQGPHFQHSAGVGSGFIAVPNLGVDFHGVVRQVDVQVRVAILVGALACRPHNEKAFKAFVLDQTVKFSLRHHNLLNVYSGSRTG